MSDETNPAPAEEASGRIKIDGKEYEYPSDFTLGEARIIKRFTGQTLDEFLAADNSDPDGIAAVVYIILKREDPSVTEEDVENLHFSQIDTGGEDDADPPADAGPGTEETPEASGIQS